MIEEEKVTEEDSQDIVPEEESQEMPAAESESPPPGKRSSVRPLVLIAAAVGLLAVGVLLVLLATFFVFRGRLGGLKATTLTDVNLRQGPGIGYPTVGSLGQGSNVKVVGRNQDGSWLQVETEEGDNAWMTGVADFVQIDQASLEKVPLVGASAPTYDAANPAVNRVMTEIPLVVYHPDHYTCASHAGLNNVLPDVAEGNVIGPHAGDFAYVDKGGNVLFKYTGGRFVLIRDNPIARFDGDVESLPLDKALQMFDSGEIVWTGEVGRWPGRGVPGCDPAAAP